MAADIKRVIRAKVDLNEPIQKTILRDVFVTESNHAHEFRIQLWRGSEHLPTTSGVVTGYFWRYKDGATIPLAGEMDVLKKEIVCVLPEACYAMRTVFSVTLAVDTRDIDSRTVKIPVFVGEGQMISGRGDVLYDPDGLVPSVGDIIAKFEEMDVAVRNADAQTELARLATAAAYAAAEKIDNMTVYASEGDAAAARIREENGAKRIDFTLPRGPSGGYYTPIMNGTMLEAWESSTPDMPTQVVMIDLKGKNFTILGTYETLDALTAAVPSPEQGDVYNVGAAAPYDMYMWNDHTGGTDDNPIVGLGEWISIGKSGYSDTGGGTGAVRSVNGVLPNEAGNVVLELSSLGKVVQQITKVPTADEEADATYIVLYTDGTTYQFTVPSGNAPVTSVNGQTGAVVLNAADVGALPADTPIPAKTSELTNDSGFIGKAVSDLANYYLKSQTYTRDEINQRISAIPKFSISAVSALPTSGISETTIYLVSGGEGSDLYTEYIHVNGAWEILGSQRVDLTGYATEAWVGTQLAGYQPAGNYALKSELPTVPTKLSQLSGDSTHRVVTDAEKDAWNGKLDADKLPAAVEDALEQAKAGGEFDGAPGDPGYTPVRGTDYWTPADQEAIVQQVIAALGTPVFGTVDENKHITLSGHLADGTYTIRFEDTDGFTADVCTIEKGGVKYTNLVPTSEAYDSKAPYNGTGYKDGYYLSGSAPYEGADAACVLTGYMPYAVPETGLPGTIYISGAEVQSISHCRIYFFGTSKTMTGSGVQGTVMTTYFTIETLSNGVTRLTPIASGDTSKLVADSKAQTATEYFRMSLVGTGENLIITVDEPIE